MNWNYYIPHLWDQPFAEWEDIWLWPVDGRIDGNMGNKINLTIDALGSLLQSDESQTAELARRLEADGRPYWIWPYPNEEDWADDVSMIVNCARLSYADVVHYATIYLRHKGFTVDSLREATEREAFADCESDSSNDQEPA